MKVPCGVRLVLCAISLTPSLIFAAIPAHTGTEKLKALRKQVASLEEGLIEGLGQQSNTRTQVKKIQTLIRFQKLERELGQKRMVELENTVSELENRRRILTEKISSHQSLLRKYLTAVEASYTTQSQGSHQSAQVSTANQEMLEAPKRRVLARLVEKGLKEIEILKADLTDALHLGGRIQEEKQELTYLFQDLKEQESVLELNKQLQIEFLKKKHSERLSQLKNYRRLKSSEAQVEHLIKNFNSRVELERVTETEKSVAQAMNQGAFAQLKGKLPFPVTGGKVVTSFGRNFDARSGLFIFKKGVDIEVGRNQPVRAISAGRVAYSGDLPYYGRVVIIDHGEHYYSLCAHLGSALKKTSDVVAAGESIGLTKGEPSGSEGVSTTALYFEIRARNVAVNPLQWVYN